MVSEDQNNSLRTYCQRLEQAVSSLKIKDKGSSPWCVGGTAPSIADVAIYHLLSTPQSIASGSTVNEKDGVEAAYSNLLRLKAIVET